MRKDEEVRKSSLVEPFRTQEDIMKMQNYFLENEKYLMFLIFEIGISMGRRIGDILELEWSHFYYKDGSRRRKLKTITEEKTDKFASPYLSDSVWKAISIYIKKTGCDVSSNNYRNKICMQLTGNYKGKVVTDAGTLKAFKQAAKEIGIKYNVGNHSTRKTFGYLSFNLFPNDPYKMQVLQKIFNHSDSNITLSYIGMSDDHAEKYYNEIGNVLCDIMDGKTVSLKNKATNLLTADYDEIRKIKNDCIIWGQNHPNANTEEIIKYMETTDDLLKYISII